MHSCKYREIACYAGELGRLPGRTVMLPTGKKQYICKVIVDSLYISTPFSHQFHILNFCHLCYKYCFPSQYRNPCQEFWTTYFLHGGHIYPISCQECLCFPNLALYFSQILEPREYPSRHCSSRAIKLRAKPNQNNFLVFHFPAYQ